MSCLEFRRSALISTNRLPERLLRHADECRCCRDFLNDSLGMEHALDEAVRVDVPSGLADRIVEARRSGVARTRKRGAAWAAGLAAAVLLVTVALQPQTTSTDLALAAIEHVMEEPRSLVVTNTPDPEIGQRTLSENGIAVPVGLGATTYASNCIYAGLPVQHFVFRGAHGSVTVLVPAKPTVSPPPSMTLAHGMRSVVVPTVSGFITVVSDAGVAAREFGLGFRAAAQPAAPGEGSGSG